MKAGATYYIMKNNLTQLVPAIESVLYEASKRCQSKWEGEELKLEIAEHKQSEEELRKSEKASPRLKKLLI